MFLKKKDTQKRKEKKDRDNKERLQMVMNVPNVKMYDVFQ